MKRILLFRVASMITFSVSWAQRTVTGTVTGEEDATPVPGVNVIVKGTSVGTVTDIDGKYQIGVPEDGGTLVFSFIGLATEEVEIGNQSTIDMVMTADIRQLTEIVVTGVGTAVDKRKVGISVEAVKGSDVVNSQAAADLSQALIGKVPGATIQSVSGQPGQQQNIILRGINSLSSTQPMILVDGVQINTDNNANGSAGNLSSRLADLDLTNIERVEVVQGAAAATIYGAQGANGVIQIFTKMGKAGKLKVDFGTSYSSSEYLRGKFNKADKHYFEVDSQGFIIDGNGNPLTPDASTGIWGTGVGEVGGNTTTSNPFMEPTYDQVDQLFKTAGTTNTYLTLSGGKDNITYLVGASYLSQESTINGSFDRLNLRLNLDMELAKGLNLSSRTTLVSSGNTTGTITSLDNVLGSLGNVMNIPQYVDIFNRDAIGNYVANPTGDNSIIPSFTFDNRRYNADVTRVMQNFNLNYEINKIFRLDGKLGYDNYRYDFRDYIKNQTEYLSNGITPIEGSLMERQDRGVTVNSLISGFADVDFQRDFGSSLPITWLTQVAFDYRYNSFDRVTATGTGTPTFTDNITLRQTANADVDGYSDEFITYGYLINMKFDYEAKVGVSGGFRSDYSSAFGKGSEPFTFPRGDAYVNLAEFEMWSGLKNVWSNFKIRAAYGEAGVQPGPFDRIQTLSPVSIDQSGSLTVPSQLNDPNIGVTLSKEFEIGTDLGFSTNSSSIFPYIGLSFTYWDRTSDDVIRALDVPPSTGSSSILTNALTFESNGIQASLNTHIIESDAFNWDFTINYSKSVNTVANIANGKEIALGNNFVISEGNPVGAFLGIAPLTSLDQQREDGSNYIEEGNRSEYEVGPRGYVVNKASKAVQFTENKVVIGDPTPDFVMSFINNFRIAKRLSLGVQLDWFQGGDIYNQTKQWLYRDLVHEDIAEPITINGETQAWTNWYQSLYSTNTPNAGFVEDGSFLRLRRLNVSYDFADLIKGMDRFQLTFAGNNLFTITDYTGLDPEATSGLNEAVERGLDQFAFPNFKTYEVRLDLTF
jgi:TonB-linked SusC/RagA family outer membrane protein